MKNNELIITHHCDISQHVNTDSNQSSFAIHLMWPIILLKVKIQLHIHTHFANPFL